MDGARRDPEFQSRLRVMDIDETDLQQLLGTTFRFGVTSLDVFSNKQTIKTLEN